MDSTEELTGIRDWKFLQLLETVFPHGVEPCAELTVLLGTSCCEI